VGVQIGCISKSRSGGAFRTAAVKPLFSHFASRKLPVNHLVFLPIKYLAAFRLK
jgi:hypothetical protein